MIPVAIVGAAGYTGRELIRLVAAHPEFELVALFGSGRGGDSVQLGDVAPELVGMVDLPVTAGGADAIAASGARVVFFATPHEASASLIPAVLDAAPGVHAVDLSAAFRLSDASAYPRWYGFEHPAPGLLGEAVYGMPERSRALGDRCWFAGDAGVRGAGVGGGGVRLVACAGCYVTAASVPLSALVAAGGLAAGRAPIIDAVSGVSGAGRGAKEHTSYCEVSATPYGVMTHRHRPEIEQAVGLAGKGGVVFQPHLGAFDRGILATIHCELAAGWEAARVGEVLERAFGDEPFVRLLGDANAGGRLPSVRAVERTNFVDIAWAVEGSHLILFSAIDNLVKGASGQAVQCANAVAGLAETLGLLPASGKAVGV